MERRRLVARWCVQPDVADCQNVGEPPTLHRLQILPRFQPETRIMPTRFQAALIAPISSPPNGKNRAVKRNLSLSQLVFAKKHRYIARFSGSPSPFLQGNSHETDENHHTRCPNRRARIERLRNRCHHRAKQNQQNRALRLGRRSHLRHRGRINPRRQRRAQLCLGLRRSWRRRRRLHGLPREKIARATARLGRSR